MFIKVTKLSENVAIVITEPDSQGYYTFGYCNK